MSEIKTIFEAIVYMENEAMRLCFSSFNQLCYHLEHLNKRLVQKIEIKPIKTGDMRQGRYDN